MLAEMAAPEPLDLPEAATQIHAELRLKPQAMPAGAIHTAGEIQQPIKIGRGSPQAK